jgi:hypothetical protein
LNIVSRTEWGARSDSRGKFGKMSGPVSKVWAHHSVTPSTVTARQAAKTLESIGMSRFGVFSYSFAIHKDGTILEGAGWNYVGAHTAGQNSSSYGFVFIGNYENEKLSAGQIKAFQWLVSEGKKRGKINRGASIDGHRNASGAATACPGRNVIAELPELRKPPKNRWVVSGVKRKKRTVTGRAKALTVKAAWKAIGYKVTLEMKSE